MDALKTPTEIEAMAEAAGKSMASVCREAGIAYSTFRRWKAGVTDPGLSVYRRLVACASKTEDAA
jgi:lambda repressor-like predicted transcriptional regulator